jgi:ribosomal protein S18 acetylase RimI-like enzyme
LPGDEIAWAEIETEVGEFDSIQEGLDCFKFYLSNIEELKKRQWFAVAPNGEIAATATAWRSKSADGSIPVVHALGCKPKFQGKGLGKAVAIKMLETFNQLDPKKDIWLDTQTWSYKAIGLYMDLGFLPLKKAVYNSVNNEYEQALSVLNTKMNPKQYKRFMENAE